MKSKKILIGLLSAFLIFNSFSISIFAAESPPDNIEDVVIKENSTGENATGSNNITAQTVYNIAYEQKKQLGFSDTDAKKYALSQIENSNTINNYIDNVIGKEEYLEYCGNESNSFRTDDDFVQDYIESQVKDNQYSNITPVYQTSAADGYSKNLTYNDKRQQQIYFENTAGMENVTTGNIYTEMEVDTNKIWENATDEQKELIKQYLEEGKTFAGAISIPEEHLTTITNIFNDYNPKDSGLTNLSDIIGVEGFQQLILDYTHNGNTINDGKYGEYIWSATIQQNFLQQFQNFLTQNSTSVSTAIQNGAADAGSINFEFSGGEVICIVDGIETIISGGDMNTEIDISSVKDMFLMLNKTLGADGQPIDLQSSYPDLYDRIQKGKLTLAEMQQLQDIFKIKNLSGDKQILLQATATSGSAASTYVAKTKQETHTYLSYIEYKIYKLDRNGSSKVKFSNSELKEYSFNTNDLFNIYIPKLDAAGYKDAADIYRKWFSALQKAKISGNTLPVSGPSLQESNKQLYFKMDFESYIVNAFGGGTLASNAEAQDFFRNYFSNIKESTQYFNAKIVYRPASEAYARVAVDHNNQVYDRQDVALGKISAPFLVKYTPSNDRMIFGYEINIYAYLRQIVDLSKVYANGLNSVGNPLEYFPYRQYVESNTCGIVGKNVSLSELEEMFFSYEEVKNACQYNPMITFDFLQNTSSGTLSERLSSIGGGTRETTYSDIFLLCDDNVHTNLNVLDNIQNQKSLHIHGVQFKTDYCETYKLLKGYGLSNFGNGTKEDIKKGWTSPWDGGSAPTNLDSWAIVSSYKYQDTCPICHGTGSVSNGHVHTSSCYDKNGTLICTDDGLDPCATTVDRYGVSIKITKDYNIWGNHDKGDCFKIVNVSDNNTKNTYYGVIDDDTSSNKNPASERCGEVKPYKQLKWYYRGILIKENGQYYILFGPEEAAGGGDVIVENFISM